MIPNTANRSFWLLLLPDSPWYLLPGTTSLGDEQHRVGTFHARLARTGPRLGAANGSRGCFIHQPGMAWNGKQSFENGDDWGVMALFYHVLPTGVVDEMIPVEGHWRPWCEAQRSR